MMLLACRRSAMVALVTLLCSSTTSAESSGRVYCESGGVTRDPGRLRGSRSRATTRDVSASVAMAPMRGRGEVQVLAQRAVFSGRCAAKLVKRAAAGGRKVQCARSVLAAAVSGSSLSSQSSNAEKETVSEERVCEAEKLSEKTTAESGTLRGPGPTRLKGDQRGSREEQAVQVSHDVCSKQACKQHTRMPQRRRINA